MRTAAAPHFFSAHEIFLNIFLVPDSFIVNYEGMPEGWRSPRSKATAPSGQANSWWQGRIVGELRPTEKIPDLDNAPRKANGLVEYSAKISLIVASNPKDGNGALLVDIPNRGRPYAQALYNSPRDEPFEAGTFEVGTGFLQDRGYSVAEVQRELGQGAELPSFTDGSGQKRFVEGVGFAVVRDVADFLAQATADTIGTANPLHGAIKRTPAVGKSQSGRYRS
jgi:hypothetical protein